jgi:hypothetical protein
MTPKQRKAELARIDEQIARFKATRAALRKRRYVTVRYSLMGKSQTHVFWTPTIRGSMDLELAGVIRELENQRRRLQPQRKEKR